MKYLISTVLLCISISLLAQENHYWSQQYGAESNLLGGAVVAGVRDNSATYYNPGALGFITHPNISVSANIYKLSNLYVENGAGEGLDLQSLRLSLAPQLLSGIINFKKNDKWRGSFVLLTRNFGNEKIVFHHEQVSNVIFSEPGDEEFIGDLTYDSQLNEQWGGFGVSRLLGKNWSLGLTTFISYRNQKFKAQSSSNTVVFNAMDYYVSSLRVDQDLVIDDFKLVWKAGLAFQSNNEQFKWGLTITSPSLHVVGFANVGREESFLNKEGVNPVTGGNFIDLLGTDRQKNINDVDYKLPLCIATGWEYSWRKSRLMATVEYFHDYGTYNIVTPEARPFIRPSNLTFDIPEDEFLAVVYPSRTVVNAAVGFDQRVSDKLSLLLGFRTDFTSFDDDIIPNDYRIILTPINYSLLHYTVGVTLHGKVSNTTVGIDYGQGFGANTSLSLIRFDRPESLYDVPVPPVKARASVNSVTIVLGFTYFFKRGEGADDMLSE